MMLVRRGIAVWVAGAELVKMEARSAWAAVENVRNAPNRIKKRLNFICELGFWKGWGVQSNLFASLFFTKIRRQRNLPRNEKTGNSCQADPDKKQLVAEMFLQPAAPHARHHHP